MANIKTHLNNIKNALFGNEVRGSIHDGIDAINKEVESTTGRQEHLETTFDQLTINAGNSNAEIVDARVKADGTSYKKLGDRLDSVDSQLEHKANDNQVVKKGYGTLNDFDEDTRKAILENNNIDINYVLGNDNVMIKNLNTEIKDNIAKDTLVDIKYNGTNGIYSVTANGSYQDFSDKSWATGYESTKIDCRNIEGIYVSCIVTGNACALALFYDENNSYVDAYKKVSDVGDNIIYNNEYIEIPSNIRYVAVGTSNKTTNPLVIKYKLKQVVNTVKLEDEFTTVKNDVGNLKNDVGDLKNGFDIKQLMRKQYSLERKNPFEWKTFDKGYFTFIFDDGRHDLNKVADIFKEYNAPLCVAIPTNRLDSICDDGVTVLNTCKRIVTNGGEVISHSVDNTIFTDSTTRDEALYKLRSSKEVLESKGFDVNGFIVPGGTGMLNRLDKFMDIMYYYYDYSDMGSSIDVAYNKERVYLNLPQFTFLNSYIKPVCDNGGFMTIMAHTIDGTEGIIDETKLRETIEFIKANNGEIVTYKFVYDNFRSSKLENLLN